MNRAPGIVNQRGAWTSSESLQLPVPMRLCVAGYGPLPRIGALSSFSVTIAQAHATLRPVLMVPEAPAQGGCHLSADQAQVLPWLSRRFLLLCDIAFAPSACLPPFGSRITSLMRGHPGIIAQKSQKMSERRLLYRACLQNR